MGYLGSSLDDYYSYQLVEKVIEQIKSGDTGDVGRLGEKLALAVQTYTEKYSITSDVVEILERANKKSGERKKDA
jgi:hypothetical protein